MTVAAAVGGNILYLSIEGGGGSGDISSLFIAGDSGCSDSSSDGGGDGPSSTIFSLFIDHGSDGSGGGSSGGNGGSDSGAAVRGSVATGRQ